MSFTNIIVRQPDLDKSLRGIFKALIILLALTRNSGVAFNAVSNHALKSSFRVPSNAAFSPSSSYNFLNLQLERTSHSILSESNDVDNDPEKIKEADTASSTEKIGIFSKIKNMYKSEPSDGLTTRQRLSKMGLSCLLSYGFVSNMSYVVSVSVAWFGFTKKTGLSPLAPGQWKPFLAVYAGFYVFNNFVRPIRFGLSVGVARYFDTAVNYIQRKTKVSKGFAIGIVVFLANICGTCSLMALGISLAASLTGVPVFPPKL